MSKYKTLTKPQITSVTIENIVAMLTEYPFNRKQKDIAKDLDIDKATLSHWVNGKASYRKLHRNKYENLFKCIKMNCGDYCQELCDRFPDLRPYSNTEAMIELLIRASLDYHYFKFLQNRKNDKRSRISSEEKSAKTISAATDEIKIETDYRTYSLFNQKIEVEKASPAQLDVIVQYHLYRQQSLETTESTLTAYEEKYHAAEKLIQHISENHNTLLHYLPAVSGESNSFTFNALPNIFGYGSRDLKSVLLAEALWIKAWIALSSPLFEKNDYKEKEIAIWKSRVEQAREDLNEASNMTRNVLKESISSVDKRHANSLLARIMYAIAMYYYVSFTFISICTREDCNFYRNLFETKLSEVKSFAQANGVPIAEIESISSESIQSHFVVNTQPPAIIIKGPKKQISDDTYTCFIFDSVLGKNKSIEEVEKLMIQLLLSNKKIVFQMPVLDNDNLLKLLRVPGFRMLAKNQRIVYSGFGTYKTPAEAIMKRYFQDNYTHTSSYFQGEKGKSALTEIQGIVQKRNPNSVMELYKQISYPSREWLEPLFESLSYACEIFAPSSTETHFQKPTASTRPFSSYLDFFYTSYNEPERNKLNVVKNRIEQKASEIKDVNINNRSDLFRVIDFIEIENPLLHDFTNQYRSFINKAYCSYLASRSSNHIVDIENCYKIDIREENNDRVVSKENINLPSEIQIDSQIREYVQIFNKRMSTANKRLIDWTSVNEIVLDRSRRLAETDADEKKILSDEMTSFDGDLCSDFWFSGIDNIISSTKRDEAGVSPQEITSIRI